MFTFKKYASPLGQFVWKHKGKISLVLGIVTTGYVQRVYRLSVAPKLIESIPMEREVALIPRDAGRHIRIAAANGIHMLVLGPHGVGKTVSVKQAVDGLTDIETINNPTTFLPFYVNLYKAVRPAVQLATAENKGVIETTQHAIDADAAKRVAAAFHAALAMFDTTMLEVTQSGWIYQLERQIGRDWASLLSFFFGSPNAPPPQSESIRPYLQQVMDSAKFSKEVYLFSKHRGFIPVVVIDEVHMLADPALPKIRDEFVAFLMEALADKRSSPVVIILLSSDGNAEKIINSWSKRGTMSRFLQPETVGDLREGEEVRQFLLALPQAAKSVKVVKGTAPPSVSALTVQAKPATGSGRQSKAADGPILYDKALERYKARVMNPVKFKQLSTRYGGYIPDLLRLYQAQLLDAEEDVDISDDSPVSGLVEDPVGSLRKLGLDRQMVSRVFTAIEASKLSPKGAVEIGELMNEGVPNEFIHRMQASNLLEIRRYTPPVRDYEELKPLLGSVYVCATCPLARESMAKVLEKLKAEDAKSWWTTRS